MLGLELALAGHLLLQVNASPSSDMSCPAQKSARVDVRWRSEPIKYDFEASVDNLNHREVDTVNPYGTHVATDVGGLMSGSVKYQSNIQISSIRFPVGHVSCMWVDKVVVDMIIDPKIMIAAEHPPGTCEHNAIMEHEYKHVAADRDVVKDHLEKIRYAAAMAVQKVGVVGPKPEGSSDNYKKKMTEYIQTSIKAQVDEMYADRITRQKAIDSREEYDRVDALCKGHKDAPLPAD